MEMKVSISLRPSRVNAPFRLLREPNTAASIWKPFRKLNISIFGVAQTSGLMSQLKFSEFLAIPDSSFWKVERSFAASTRSFVQVRLLKYILVYFWAAALTIRSSSKGNMVVMLFSNPVALGRSSPWTARFRMLMRWMAYSA